jgi:hypothetical protein
MVLTILAVLVGRDALRQLLRVHEKGIWACDFVQLYDAFFRPIFAFFIVEHARRRVVQLGVTRAPSDA